MDADRIAPFGRAVALALLAGCMFAMQWSSLPPWWVAIALCALGALGWRRGGVFRLAGAACVGLGWCLVHAHAAWALRIDPRVEDRPLLLHGQVSGLPERDADRQRFGFRIDHATLDGRSVPVRGEVRLSHWRDPTPILAGEHLELVAVLRRPRGLLNPGGFDFERLAIERRIAATGHVRRIIARAPVADGIDVRRARLADIIGATIVDADAAALLRALAVGDQAAIADPLWEAFRATGTTHLVAISGFHIGLVGAFAALLGGLAHRALPGAGWRVPRRTFTACCALAGASAYSLLAGLSLPVQRTLAMLAAVLLAVALRRRLSIGGALALAVIAVLLFDPLAVLNAGFWLSFGGVFWLLFALDGRSRDAWWRGYARAQWVAFVALLPLGVAWFQQASLVGPLVNLFAIPWVSFLMVPLLLAGLALGDLGGPLLRTAGLTARVYLDGLSLAAAAPLASIDLPPPGATALVLALAGAAAWLLPRAVPGRPLAVLLFLPLLLPRIERPTEGAVDVVVLDVGQGMAIVVRTANHALLFDAGPARSEGYDSGEAIVLPALRALGVRRLDRVVVSHGDNDHAGGVPAVLRAFPRAQVESGPGAGFGATCSAGRHWRWDGVEFGFLHPPTHFPAMRNEASCVLRIVAGNRAALLPGDIGEIIEARLVNDGTDLSADLLLLAHHGSRGSNSARFIDTVRPRIAVASAGHRNRFGHPAPEVAARLAARGIPLHATATSGALRYRLSPGALVVLSAERRAARRAWREP